MKSQPLNGLWTLEVLGSSFLPVDAVVPGSVYNDLLTADLIPDPFYRDNEIGALKLMEHDFKYSRSFTVDADLLSSDAVLLRCEGLDTIADIYVNGCPVGHAENMHRVWEFDVKELLHIGENAVSVHFASPTKYIKEAYSKSVADGSSDAMVGFPLIRKAHCMFGWDWGPRLPDAGIWRDISVIGIDCARIRDVQVLQRHEEDRVTLEIHTHVDHLTDDDTQVEVSVTTPTGQVLMGGGKRCFIVIEQPELWWPAGLGGQPLYTVCVELCAEGGLDKWQRRIGLRTMTVSRRRDEWGESFSHCVNGVDIFAMGADYIPEDNLLPRVTPSAPDACWCQRGSVRKWYRRAPRGI